MGSELPGAVLDQAGPASGPQAGALEGSKRGQFGHGQTQFQGKAAHKAPNPPPSKPGPKPAAEQTDLDAMRRVIDNPKARDRTPKEKNFRAILENYPHSFLKAKAELERQEREDRLGAAAGADAGSARVRAAVERLRKAHKEKAWGEPK